MVSQGVHEGILYPQGTLFWRYVQYTGVGSHSTSSPTRVFSGPQKRTSRVSAHAGICTYPEKVCVRAYLPLLHTPGYRYSIPVAFTSNIVLDTQLKFPRFQEANRQSIDDAFTLCSVPPLRASFSDGTA